MAWSDLRAPVASCPGWTTYDLVVHLGNVHAWAATIVETGRAAAEQNDEPRTPEARTVVSAVVRRQGRGPLRGAQRRPTRPPCWNFAFGTGRASFWPRRQLHETTDPPGRPRPDARPDAPRSPRRSRATASTRCCGDAAPDAQRGHPAALDRPVALTATDTGDTWVVAPQPAAPRPTPMVPAQPVGTASETRAASAAPASSTAVAAGVAVRPRRGAGRRALPAAVAPAGRRVGRRVRGGREPRAGVPGSRLTP